MKREAFEVFLMIISGVVGGVLGVIITELYNNFSVGNFLFVLLGIALIFETVLLCYILLKPRKK